MVSACGKDFPSFLMPCKNFYCKTEKPTVIFQMVGTVQEYVKRDRCSIKLKTKILQIRLDAEL